jgi:hypothetical protein
LKHFAAGGARSQERSVKGLADADLGGGSRKVAFLRDREEIADVA